MRELGPVSWNRPAGPRVIGAWPLLSLTVTESESLLRIAPKYQCSHLQSFPEDYSFCLWHCLMAPCTHWQHSGPQQPPELAHWPGEAAEEGLNGSPGSLWPWVRASILRQHRKPGFCALAVIKHRNFSFQETSAKTARAMAGRRSSRIS